ncbi:MAG TPA: hypothetical protein VG142_18395 [Trebonia sp.]|jgi:hypothetical protein|nr:hypothetical protein [Trebonia sp.]
MLADGAVDNAGGVVQPVRLSVRAQPLDRRTRPTGSTTLSSSSDLMIS